MLFPTATFAVFFVVALVGAWAFAPRPTLRKMWLVAAGGFFYSYWDTRFVLLLAGTVFATWGLGRAIARARSPAAARWFVVAGITAGLVVLAVFKYYDFFFNSVTDGLARLGIHAHPPLLQFALPVGVSFYLLSAFSYLIDVRRGRLPAAGLLDIATWLCFFPTLTSGPITRATEFVPQLQTDPRSLRIDTSRALTLIARGLAKKLVVASYLATAITDDAFANPHRVNAFVMLVAVYAYAVQIYADFSGYTDMALGFGALLGFTLPPNFDRPYTATSVQDFWSRWHMTLSRWLRDYLFAPLTGRREIGLLRTSAAIVGVMLIAGLWHGAAWSFVVFGGVHGAAMAVERMRRIRRRRLGRPPQRPTAVRRVWQQLVTFHIVCLGWVFFAAGSVHRGVDVLAAIATNWSTPVDLLTPLLFVTVVGLIAMQYLPSTWSRPVAARAARLRPALQSVGFAAALVPILSLAPATVPAFIYYRF